MKQPWLNDGGMTIIMVTHDSGIARLCQRIIWFQDGKIIDSQLTTADYSHQDRL